MGTSLLLLLGAIVASPATDFGIRVVGAEAPTKRSVAQTERPTSSAGSGGFNLLKAAEIVGRYGRITSMKRSPERNRRVGGVPNSWHLRGRAIDVVRSPSVSHASLAGALRRQGYHLIESLDEGDHSHFAFGNGTNDRGRSAAEQIAEVRQEADYFRFVEVPGSRRAERRSAMR